MKEYTELFGKIQKFILNKDVLDIGCVAHNIHEEKSYFWVHRFLKKYARNVKGIDILEEEIKKLRDKGYEVYNKNAENFKFKEKFDVIFAGEVIEHLSNPGLFLYQCNKNLKSKGILIITTPNSFNLYDSLKNLITLTDNPEVNSQHTCYYTPTVLIELGKRFGFKIIQKDYFANYGSIKGKIRFCFQKVLGDKFRRNMIIIFIKEK